MRGISWWLYVRVFVSSSAIILWCLGLQELFLWILLSYIGMITYMSRIVVLKGFCGHVYMWILRFLYLIIDSMIWGVEWLRETDNYLVFDVYLKFLLNLYVWLDVCWWNTWKWCIDEPIDDICYASSLMVSKYGKKTITCLS